jgi:hypothetical protein
MVGIVIAQPLSGGDSIMAKSKSAKASDGGQKATGHGRTKQKSGGEPQKKRTVPRGLGRRSGSSKG